MVIGVNGAIGQNVINLVEWDFKIVQEFVTILNLTTEETIVLEMLRKSCLAIYTPVLVSRRKNHIRLKLCKE